MKLVFPIGVALSFFLPVGSSSRVVGVEEQSSSSSVGSTRASDGGAGGGRQLQQSVPRRNSQNGYSHRRINGGDCATCDYELYYTYSDASSTEYLNGVLTSPPTDCALAAIRDEDSRRGAQYAIPPGKIAITQGVFPISDYISDCHFENQDSADNATVTGCDDDYQSYFINFDGSEVLSSLDAWVELEYPLDAGRIFAAIGADGLLRPVIQHSSSVVDFGYTGAVYECCPDDADVCTVVKTTTTTST